MERRRERERERERECTRSESRKQKTKAFFDVILTMKRPTKVIRTK